MQSMDFEMTAEFAFGRFRLSSGRLVQTISLDETHYDWTALIEATRPGKFPATLNEMLPNWVSWFGRIVALIDDLRTDSTEMARFRFLPAGAKIASPIDRPGKIMCAAANYKAHVAEMSRSNFGVGGQSLNQGHSWDAPYHFIKASSCMVGPEDDIVIPSVDHRIDWEIELGVVIGAAAKSVPQDKAMAHVAGYVLVNDVSCRAATWREDRPNIRSDWLAGKSYDTFLPVGPLFVPAQFVRNYGDLRLQLWVNGDVEQDGYASDMIFNIEQQLEYLSEMLTLEPGDMIVTGTPAGVGQGSGKFLKPGDVVEAQITGLGRHRNEVRG